MARIDIPDDEIEWTFTTSGGPGGQHANRSATRAELRWDITTSTAIDDRTRAVLIERMQGASNGVVTVAADGSRSQWRNRQEARRRLAERVAEALRPVKPRRPTKISRGAKERRRQAKKRRSDVKKLRRRPEID